MTAPLLRIADLSVEGRRPDGAWAPIVRGVSVSVAAGEMVALIGQSGAGKTTVALAALCYMRPGTRVVGGRITLDGVDILAMAPRDRRRARGQDVAYVAQSAQASLNPAIPLGDQVAEPLLLHGLASPAEARRRTIALLARLDLPSPEALARRYPHQASGGQQQRIMVAMALSCAPKLIVFDEPTTALDVTTQVEVLKAIKEVLREHNSAALYVSHDLAVVAQVADRIVVLKDGAVVEEGAAADIIERPKAVYTRQLIAAAKPATVHRSAPTGRSNVPLLTLAGISSTYSRPKLFGTRDRAANVLDDVSIELRTREVVAIVGESGSGKSTLARVIAGLHPSCDGVMTLAGQPLAPRARQRSRDTLRRIQIVFQSPDLSLNPAQPVGEAIGRPLSLYFNLTGAARRAQIAELLATVDLPADLADRYPAELSGGQRQRVAIARAFAAKPDIVLCDEILASLDTVVAAQVLRLMRDLRARHAIAYLFISHDLETVASIADRVVVLYAGRVCEIGPTQCVFKPPHHPYTSLLLSSVPVLRQGWLTEVLRTRPPTQTKSEIAVPRDAGCPFRTRCPLAIPGTCDILPPPGRQSVSGHVVYCHREAAELLG